MTCLTATACCSGRSPARRAAHSALADLFEGDDGEPRTTGEFGLVAAGGRRVDVNLSVTPLPPATNSAWSIVATDISERVRRDALLRQASEHARSLIEASLDPLVTISAAGKITDLNEATTRVTVGLSAPR